MRNVGLYISKSGAKGKTLAALLMVIASLLFSSTAWAGAGFWDEGTWSVTFSGGSSQTFSGNKNGVSDKALGTVTSLSIGSWWAKTWKDGGGNVCDDTYLCWKTGNTEHSEKGTADWSGSNCTFYKNPSSITVADANKTPGNYTLQIWFTAKGNENGTDGCGSTLYASNNGGNYKATFTIPGFTTTSTSKDFGELAVGSNSSQTISFTQHYGTALTKSNCVLTGTGNSAFEVTSINETGVTVKFTAAGDPGSRNATLTITDAHSKTCTITLSGLVSGGSPTPPTPTTAPKIYIYTTNFAQPAVWTWKNGDTNTHYTGNSWPGNRSTAEGVSNWYSITLADAAIGVSYMYIINNNNGGVQTADLGPATGDVACWFNNGEGDHGQQYGTDFFGSWDSFSAGTAGTFSGADLAMTVTKHFEAGTHTWRTKINGGWQTMTLDNTRGDITLTRNGDNAQFTLASAMDVTLCYDPGHLVAFAKAAGAPAPTTETTVLIAQDEEVSGADVSLYGYLKYTGCLAITEYGFVYAAEDVTHTPTISNTKVQAGTSSIAAGTDFNKTFTVGNNGTYYYRSYVIAGGEPVYSEEIRTFTVEVGCSITNADPTSVTAQFSDGKTTTSAEFVNSSASIGLTLGDGCFAETYAWSCVTKPAGSTATIANASARTTNVTVNTVGTYTFQITATCQSGAISATSAVITLNVCAPAGEQTLYLDNYTSNVLCPGEKAVATCISQEGYSYTLYLGDRSFGTLTGNGSTLTWRNVEGAGTFEVKSSPTDLPQCAVTIGSASQTYNEPNLGIDVNPGASVIAFKDVTLTKSSDSDVDTDLIWTITQGSEGYLLNTTRLEYDNRAKESVIFKGAAESNAATTYKVSATGSKTVVIPGADASKTCDATEVVTIQVSPAVDHCD